MIDAFGSPIIGDPLLINFVTVVYSIIISFVEVDVKKVVVYRTINQVSLIGIMLSIGLVDLGLVHMLGHSFYKRSLFIQIGNFMLLSGHNQLFGLRQRLISFSSSTSVFVLLLNMFSLMGVSFIAGF